MPASFDFPPDAALWIPVIRTRGEVTERGSHKFYAIGRLEPGVSLRQAQSDMDTIAARLEKEYPDSNRDLGIKVVALQEDMVGDFRPVLLVLMGAVGFVLLIACANVANLLLARSATREKEIAIRAALGASRGRIITQMLTESVLLALAAGIAGSLIAFWSLDALIALAPKDVPRLTSVHLDPTVFGFTLFVSVLTGAIFGLAPSWQVSRGNVNESLNEGSVN